MRLGYVVRVRYDTDMEITKRFEIQDMIQPRYFGKSFFKRKKLYTCRLLVKTESLIILHSYAIMTITIFVICFSSYVRILTKASLKGLEQV